MKKLLLILIAILSFTFTSCTIDNSIHVPDPYIYCWYWQPYQVNGNGYWLMGGPVNNYSAAQTRAYKIQSTDILSDYDNFSLFSWTPDSVVMNNYTGTINYQTYTWGYASDKKYFDNNVSKYSFIGIIPQSNLSIKSDKSVDVTLDDFKTEGVNPNDEKYNKEFIVASTEVEKANYSQGATLNFYHQNSIVRIKFETDATNILEILDFTPYNPGTPGQAAWDETVDVTTYQMTATTIPAQGPAIVDINITDEDIAYVNSKYTSSKGFANYATNNAITGPLDEDMYAYLLSKYPALATATLNNWASNVGNSNMRLVHIDKTGAYNTYVGVWVNVQNVNWGSGTTTQTVIHHDAVAAVPATGKEGIVVIPATSENQTGKDAIISIFPTNVTANVSLSGVTYTVNSTVDEMIFTKAGNINYSVYSPTNWYTFPVVHNTNFGFTIKFSYTLNGETRYDARVFVPAVKCNWQPGKWYDYVISVNTTHHGKVDPTDADKNDPKIEDEYPIIVNSTPSNVDTYTEGEIWTFGL